jgi:hypothetical protein
MSEKIFIGVAWPYARSRGITSDQVVNMAFVSIPVYRLDFYDQTSIKTILKRSAHILGIEAEAGGWRK